MPYLDIIDKIIFTVVTEVNRKSTQRDINFTFSIATSDSLE